MKDTGSGRLAILAGRGELPWIAAREALARGEQDLRIFCISDEEPPEDLRDFAEPVVLTRLYSSVFRSFRRHGIKRLLLLGKATRDILYNKPRFDVRTVLLLARMLSQSDYALFENVAREVDKLGITIINQDEYLQHLFLQPGRYGKKLTTEQLKDIEFGLQHAREMNRLDIGQTVVVGKRSVLAVEAAEGTDQCIVRGGDLFHNKGAVVCKLSKEQHD
ncbi:MAG: UDP-2,3-diacylglucosamine diphosphatase LpxI, partial [Leptospiraceae bacterium]|nr:UDP-2,3-diacylglucosamine diphosphatase LpxI [Leptospiraceae bacterium]